MSKLNLDRLLDEDYKIGELVEALFEPDHPYTLAKVVSIIPKDQEGNIILELRPTPVFGNSSLTFKVEPKDCRRFKQRNVHD